MPGVWVIIYIYTHINTYINIHIYIYVDTATMGGTKIVSEMLIAKQVEPMAAAGRGKRGTSCWRAFRGGVLNADKVNMRT